MNDNDKKYIVDYVANYLQDFLDKNPHPNHKLISCQYTQGSSFILVWEKIEKPYDRTQFGPG